MSEQTQLPDHSGKNSAEIIRKVLKGYREWVAGLNDARRKQYRVLQIAACVLAMIVLLWGCSLLVIREPKLPPTPVIPDLPSISGSSSGSAEVSVVNPSASSSDSSDSSGDVSQTPSQLPGTEEVHITQSGQRKGVYTILLVGRDTVSGSTDTMILLTYDTLNNEAHALTLPRDTMVNVSWGTKKLNTVFSYYKGTDKKKQVEKGMAALKTHVGKLTGITPNFYVCVEWDAVGELVDAINGVTFDVPYNMDYDDPVQELHIHQLKGVRHLNGDDAMQVIRWRKNNVDSQYGHIEIGDSGRMKIQQDFLMAVAKECLQLKNVWNIPELAQVFVDNVKTDLSLGNLIWFGQKVLELDAEKGLEFATMPYYRYNHGASYLLPKVDELLNLLNDKMNPYQREIRKSDLEALVLQKDGSFTVTSGKLVDTSLAGASGTET